VGVIAGSAAEPAPAVGRQSPIAPVGGYALNGAAGGCPANLGQKRGWRRPSDGWRNALKQWPGRAAGRRGRSAPLQETVDSRIIGRVSPDGIGSQF